MSFMSEFREFIDRGNVMDMAVGVIIGGAFTSIVTSLTNNIINPIITLITGGHGTELGGLAIKVTDTVAIDFGAFISACINFLIIALIVFCLVKGFNKMRTASEKLVGKQQEEVAEPAAPTCPYCLEEVKPGATRCPHCGGTFDKPASAE